MNREDIVILYLKSRVTYCTACHHNLSDRYLCPSGDIVKCAWDADYDEEYDEYGEEYLVQEFNNTTCIPIATVISCDGRQHGCNISCISCAIHNCIEQFKI